MSIGELGAIVIIRLPGKPARNFPSAITRLPMVVRVTFAEGSGSHQYYNLGKAWPMRSSWSNESPRTRKENKPPHRHSGCGDPSARRHSASRCVRRHEEPQVQALSLVPSGDGQTDRECEPYAQTSE